MLIKQGEREKTLIIGDCKYKYVIWGKIWGIQKAK
jgi:hypothetical protein